MKSFNQLTKMPTEMTARQIADEIMGFITNSIAKYPLLLRDGLLAKGNLVDLVTYIEAAEKEIKRLEQIKS